MATYTPPRSASPGGRPPGPSRARGDYPSPRTQGRGTSPGRTMPPPAREMPPRRPARPRPKDPGTRPVSAPRHTRPVTGLNTPARTRSPRMPFILLLVGLLGGALVSLLVISTTLAQGSYRISSLQQQNADLAKQEQNLTQQVAQASSPATIAQEAEEFGMRPNPALQFINLKTGKVVKGKVSKADAEINVPGYNP